MLLIMSGNIINMNASDYNYDTFRIESPNTGLRLLMKTDYDEYCGNDELRGGAGFIMQVHGKQEESTFELKPLLRLSPGYDFRVSLKLVLYDRQTENLGLCARYVPLGIAPKAKIYVQQLCVAQCIGEVVLKNCNLAMYKDYFLKKAKEYNLRNVTASLACMSYTLLSRNVQNANNCYEIVQSI